MKPVQLTLIVSVAAIYYGCDDVARDDQPDMLESAMEIRIVSDDQIEFGGDSFSSEQIELLLNSVEQSNSARRASDVRVVLRVAPQVRTGLVEDVADALGERGFDTIYLRLIIERTPGRTLQGAPTEAPGARWDSLDGLEVAVATAVTNVPEADSENPTIHVSLKAGEDGSLNQLYFGATPLGSDVPQCFERLNNQIAGLVGASGAFVSELAVELDAAGSLQFHYTFAALAACAGRDAENGRWTEYIQTLRFGSTPGRIFIPVSD